MSTYTQLLYHIVFSTKDRTLVLAERERIELYKYIWGFIRKRNCVLYRINGMEDHLHLLVSLRPDISLSDFVRDLKSSSSLWINSERLFPLFSGWQSGYGAFTYAMRDKEVVINYIINQQEHHRKFSYAEELRSLLKEVGVEVDERYFP